MRSHVVLWPLVLAALQLVSANPKTFTKEKEAVRLEDIKALTFHDGKETTHRRVRALPQLQCTGGSARPHHTPSSIRCTNAGSSYTGADIEWTCTASLPPEFKLGSTDVICEGYDSPEDEWILKGSCACEYRLLLTDLGEEKFGGGAGGGWFGSGSGSGSARERNGNEEEAKVTSGLPPTLFIVVFLAIAGWILYALLTSLWRSPAPPRRGPTRSDNPAPGSNYPYDDDDSNDPPPPYQPYTSPKLSQTKPKQTRTNTPRAPRQSRTQTQGQNQGQWQPGFWTGTAASAAAGAAAGWFAGGRGAGSGEASRQRAREQGRWDPGEGSSRGSWFGGGGGFGGGRGGGSVGGGGGSGGGMSSERYESTGFGGTRRR